MLDKAQLGKRYVCFQCGTKFYDLNRPVPLCPECNADQTNAPVRDIKALLSGRSRLREEDDDDFADGEAADDDDDEFAEEDGFDDDEGGTEDYDDDEGAGGGEEEAFDDE